MLLVHDTVITSGVEGSFSLELGRLVHANLDMLGLSPDNGNTALHEIVRGIRTEPGLQEKILRTFLDGHSDGCSLQNVYRETPLHTAISPGEAELARLLINAKAGLSLRDNLERTPLDLAKKLDSAEIVATIHENMGKEHVDR
ncbi:hypothetical protein E4T42_07627 [Aureobasidium subglaciale]|nr:hypothetical protein E4T42_07627 [Aureobasidium subglaciale]